MSILITGATGGFGKAVLSHLTRISPSTPTFGSTRNPNSVAVAAAAAASALALPYTLRAADFSSPTTMNIAFSGISKLLIISTDTFDVSTRNAQHSAAIDAAIHAGVTQIYYTSLNLSGTHSSSKMGVMASHLFTEQYLKNKHESGQLQSYTVLRVGVYADAFPFFLSWFPDTKKVVLPADGTVSWASRDELAEGTAQVMLSDNPRFRNQIIYLTGPEAITMRETTAVISEALGRNVEFELVSREQFVRGFVENGKPEWLGELWAGTYDGLREGEGSVVTDELERALGRRPLNGREWIKETLGRDKEYRWHQNEGK